MCGRFSLGKPVAEIVAEFDLPWPDSARFLPGFNLAPTRETPVIAQDAPRQLRLMRWGLVPAWAKELSIGNRLINARGETVAEKPAFRRLVGRRRCAVVAEGYYEWQKRDGGKVPHFIYLPDRRLMTFAGLWDSWQTPDRDGPLYSYTIVTTAAAPAIAHLHDRMPVVLTGQALDTWLDPGVDRPPAVLDLLIPYAGALACHPVSTAVNRPRHDGPDCLAPVG